MLKVEIDRKPTIYVPTVNKMAVRQHYRNVLLLVDDRRVEMTTIVAHKIGYTIAMAIPKLSPQEIIVLKINGERIELLPDAASKLSTGLLRKADAADDFQRGIQNDWSNVHGSDWLPSSNNS